jgi:Mg-chelatase subunit ChlD
MTIIVFLVDTSASMQQKAFVSGRSTLLDVAKGAVETEVDGEPRRSLHVVDLRGVSQEHQGRVEGEPADLHERA